MNLQSLHSMISAQATADLPGLARQFQQAQPFRNIVIDGFLEPGFAARLLGEFPVQPSANFMFQGSGDGTIARKHVRGAAVAESQFRAADARLLGVA